MTRRVGNLILIEPEEPQQCDFCGEIRELRPYGPNGECICYQCGEKDLVGTVARITKRLLDVDLTREQAEEYLRARDLLKEGGE